MKALFFEKPFDLKIKDILYPPTPKEKEVKISIKNIGICGADHMGYQGKHAFFTYPRLPGHEFSGIVKEIGKGVTKVKEGDGVCGEPLIPCGKCLSCLYGDYNVCENLKVMGIHTDGAFCEEIIMKERFVHLLPSNVSFEEGAMIEPFSVSLNSARRTKLTTEDSLTILGAGTIGLCTLKVAKAYGVRVIVSIDVNEDRLAIAKKMGATITINPLKEEDILQSIKENTGLNGTSVVIEASGAEQSLDNAFKIAAYRGNVGIVGFYKSPQVKITPVEIVKKQLNVYGSRLYWNRFPFALNLISEGKVDLTELITHRFSFTDIEKAFQAGADPKNKTLKVMVKISGE